MKSDSFEIWSGVYKSFGETPSDGEGFESDQWLNASSKKIIDFKSELKSNKKINSFNNTVLHVVASLEYPKKGSLKILDFGGGLGITYLQLINSIPDSEKIDFAIVEGKNVCERGAQTFPEDPRVRFLDSLPARSEKFDILHISSALQYIDQWKELINKLCSYRAKYFVFSDLPAGSAETYATVQQYYDSKISCWFFSEDDVLQEMSNNNYDLIHASLFDAKILGKFSRYPMGNFEDRYQIGKSKNYIFRLK